MIKKLSLNISAASQHNRNNHIFCACVYERMDRFVKKVKLAGDINVNTTPCTAACNSQSDSAAFSILADEIADISRKEQLSLAVRYMAEIEGRVQAIVKHKFPRALFVHCSSHRMNLVVNDLNTFTGVRNSVGTIKPVIKFFCDNTIMVPLNTQYTNAV